MICFIVRNTFQDELISDGSVINNSDMDTDIHMDNPNLTNEQNLNELIKKNTPSSTLF